jgi:hypothetical protein
MQFSIVYNTAEQIVFLLCSKRRSMSLDLHIQLPERHRLPDVVHPSVPIASLTPSLVRIVGSLTLGWANSMASFGPRIQRFQSDVLEGHTPPVQGYVPLPASPFHLSLHQGVARSLFSHYIGMDHMVYTSFNWRLQHPIIVSDANNSASASEVHRDR